MSGTHAPFDPMANGVIPFCLSVSAAASSSFQRRRHLDVVLFEQRDVVEKSFRAAADRQAVHFAVQRELAQVEELVGDAQLFDDRRHVEQPAGFGVLQRVARAAEQVEDFRRIARGHLGRQLREAVDLVLDAVELELQAGDFRFRFLHHVVQNRFPEFLRFADLNVPERNGERLGVLRGSVPDVLAAGTAAGPKRRANATPFPLAAFSFLSEPHAASAADRATNRIRMAIPNLFFIV